MILARLKQGPAEEHDNLATRAARGELDADSARKFARHKLAVAGLPAWAHCLRRPFRQVGTLAVLASRGGGWVRAAATFHPKLEVLSFDIPTINAANRELLQDLKPSVSARTKYVDGNIFRDPPPPADGYLLNSVLHDWNPEIQELLLRNIARGLKRGGRLWINEALLNPDRQGPRFTALFNVHQNVQHRTNQLTMKDLTRRLRAAGFGAPTVVSKAASYSLLLTKRKDG
jgi:hypothetical protein